MEEAAGADVGQDLAGRLGVDAEVDGPAAGLGHGQVEDDVDVVGRGGQLVEGTPVEVDGAAVDAGRVELGPGRLVGEAGRADHLVALGGQGEGQRLGHPAGHPDDDDPLSGRSALVAHENTF